MHEKSPNALETGLLRKSDILLTSGNVTSKAKRRRPWGRERGHIAGPANQIERSGGANGGLVPHPVGAPKCPSAERREPRRGDRGEAVPEPANEAARVTSIPHITEE